MQKLLQYRNKVSITQHGVAARGRDIYFSSENTKKILCVVLVLSNFYNLNYWCQYLAASIESVSGREEEFCLAPLESVQ